MILTKITIIIYFYSGGANYSEIAPPKSYINVEDFTNPSQLSEYLQYLVKNHTAYEDYFQWKKYFKVHATKSDQNRAMCQVSFDYIFKIYFYHLA